MKKIYVLCKEQYVFCKSIAEQIKPSLPIPNIVLEQFDENWQIPMKAQSN